MRPSSKPAPLCLRDSLQPSSCLHHANRWAQASSLLAGFLVLALPGTCGEPCPGVPSEAVAQLTAERCDGCFALEEFVSRHKYVYVLFYRSSGRLNLDLRAKFQQTAQEWRWSRVHFAQIDTDQDKPMAEKWMEPHMTPTNIIFRDGQGVQVDVKDFDILKKKYDAAPEGQRWWLTKYLGEDKVGTNLHYATPIQSSKSLKKILRQRNKTLVGFFKTASGDAWEAFHEFAWRAHQADGANATGDAVPLMATDASLTFATVAGRADLAPEGARVVPSAVMYMGSSSGTAFSFAKASQPKARQDLLRDLSRWVAGQVLPGRAEEL